MIIAMHAVLLAAYVLYHLSLQASFRSADRCCFASFPCFLRCSTTLFNKVMKSNPLEKRGNM